jgi:hypothetical protein
MITLAWILAYGLISFVSFFAVIKLMYFFVQSTEYDLMEMIFFGFLALVWPISLPMLGFMVWMEDLKKKGVFRQTYDFSRFLERKKKEEEEQDNFNSRIGFNLHE